jgi:hypothetical protein
VAQGYHRPIARLPTLADVWPELVSQLEPLVRAQEGQSLADALSSAEVSGLCGCGQSNCFTFSTKSYASRGAEFGSSIVIEHAPGLVVLDVGGDRRLLKVEILDWGGLRPSYRDFCKRVRAWR